MVIWYVEIVERLSWEVDHEAVIGKLSYSWEGHKLIWWARGWILSLEVIEKVSWEGCSHWEAILGRGLQVNLGILSFNRRPFEWTRSYDSSPFPQALNPISASLLCDHHGQHGYHHHVILITTTFVIITGTLFSSNIFVIITAITLKRSFQPFWVGESPIWLMWADFTLTSPSQPNQSPKVNQWNDLESTNSTRKMMRTMMLIIIMVVMMMMVVLIFTHSRSLW